MKKFVAALCLSMTCALLAGVPALAATSKSRPDTLGSARNHTDSQNKTVTKQVALFAMKFKVLGTDAHSRATDLSLSMVSLSGEPATSKVGRETSYVSGATQKPNHSRTYTKGTVSWMYTKGKVWEGVNVTLTPFSERDGKILVTYAIDIAKLVSLNTVEYGGAKIQTPDVAEKKASGAVVVESGKPMTIRVNGQYTVTFEVNRT